MTRAAIPLACLTAVVLAACGGPTTYTPQDAATPVVSKPAKSTSPNHSTTATHSATPTERPSESASPSPAASTVTPSDTSPSATATETAAAGDTGSAANPVWYPNWSADGGKGQAQPWPAAWPRPKVFDPTGSGALDGKIILIDPGHNLGNSTHSSKINQHYWVGLDKICNTTGTATASGYEEATYTFDVAKRLATKLTAAGATVVFTRNQNSSDTYGPCIQGRGLLGGEVNADFGVSIHADGGPSSGHGAFVYTPAPLKGYTSQAKADASARLARSVLDGLAANGLEGSTYLVPNIAPDREQGTLNTATTPMVIVETLNMANASDAHIAESASGRERVAEGLAAGITAYASR